MLYWVGELKDTLIFLDGIPDINILLIISNHDSLMFWSPDTIFPNIKIIEKAYYESNIFEGFSSPLKPAFITPEPYMLKNLKNSQS